MSDRRFQCTICFEEFVEGIEGVEAACYNNHPWCRDCITRAAETAIRNVTDPSCMPPRCCGDPVLPTDIDDDNDINTTNNPTNTTNPNDHHAAQQQHAALRLLGPAARAS
ncbi:hypothetical protein F5144DRAFT_543302 [Chaetomium tenue]|uniref:Uncharacterized protein n=1 Tax=Chaetomium tenue TaxID=1854479 RepID=A0ACB7PRX5_9PEZI|nr:hypothetical protein F5144DRAFT_543302 [Chaetomium globosum]